LRLFAAAFGVAIGLMAWTINLSVNRLLFADGYEQSTRPVQSKQDRLACGADGIEIPCPPSLQVSAETIEPCHTAELQPYLGSK
jgi:hypothetical protein